MIPESKYLFSNTRKVEKRRRFKASTLFLFWAVETLQCKSSTQYNVETILLTSSIAKNRTVLLIKSIDDIVSSLDVYMITIGDYYY